MFLWRFVVWIPVCSLFSVFTLMSMCIQILRTAFPMSTCMNNHRHALSDVVLILWRRIWISTSVLFLVFETGNWTAVTFSSNNWSEIWSFWASKTLETFMYSLSLPCLPWGRQLPENRNTNLVKLLKLRDEAEETWQRGHSQEDHCLRTFLAVLQGLEFQEILEVPAEETERNQWKTNVWMWSSEVLQKYSTDESQERIK